SRVVLPQPLGPTRLTNSPGATSKLMSSRARTLPSTKDLPTCLKEMSGSVNVDVRSLRQAPSANPFLGIAQGADDQRCEDHEHDDHREILVHLEAVAGLRQQAAETGLRHGELGDHGADRADRRADAKS